MITTRASTLLLVVTITAFTVISTSGLPSHHVFLQRSGELDVRNGRVIFERTCSNCHSRRQESSKAGPTLARIGLAANSRKPGMSAEAYIIESITQPDAFKAPDSTGVMPLVASGLSQSQIHDLTAYLMTLGGTVSAANITAIKIDQSLPIGKHKYVDRQKIDKGEQIFKTKGQCINCHYRNSVLAPSLNGISVKGETYIEQSIMEPSAVITAPYRFSKILMDSGRVIIGRIIEQDAERITCSVHDLEDGLSLCKIRLDDIARNDDDELIISESEESLMPSNYKTLLSEEEMTSLLYFLNSLPTSYY